MHHVLFRGGDAADFRDPLSHFYMTGLSIDEEFVTFRNYFVNVPALYLNPLSGVMSR